MGRGSPGGLATRGGPGGVDSAGAIVGGAEITGPSSSIVFYEPVTADPRVSGLDRNVGSTVVIASSGAVFYKWGSGTKQWRPLAPETIEDVERSYLAGRLAAAATDYQWTWVPFESFPAAFGVNASGTGNYSKRRGGVRLTSGATASGQYQWQVGNLSKYDLRIPGGTNGVWGLSARLAVPTAIDAQAFAWLGAIDAAGGSWLRVGFIGSLSATNYVLQYDGSFVDLAVAKDNNPHVFRVFRIGGTTKVEIDGVERASGNYFPANDCGPYGLIANNATAAERIIDCYHIGILSEKGS